jgi:glycosyltransferase involved in cell wall biosynthesis
MVSAHGDPSFGGTEKHVVELASQLARSGHEVSFLLAFPGPDPLPGAKTTVLHGSDWREDDLRRLRNHIDAFLALPTAQLAEAVSAHQPDVVHTHNLQGITTGVWEVCRRQGVPVVHTLHDYYLLCPRVTLRHRDATPCRPSPLLCGARARSLGRWARAVSHVIGVSRFVLDRHAGVFLRAHRHLIRHPVVVERAGSIPPPRSRLRAIGYIGSLDRIKGVHLLLEVAPYLGELGIEVRLAGRGRIEAEVSEIAARHANVHYEGAVSGAAKVAFLASCDLGIVPSVWDEPGGPSYTMIDWLAAERPVLVSRRGGLAEVIDDFPGSIGIEPSVESISEAVQGLRAEAIWPQAVASVRVPDRGDDLERWVAAHDLVYRAARVR